jgi:hypothetical protein
MPEVAVSVSPAWDPLSRTPQLHQEHDYDLPSSIQDMDDHDQGRTRSYLLDEQLLNAQLKVLVTGGYFNGKEVTASIQADNGVISIRYKLYKTTTILNPDWVTPKYPNPTRDNGLLIVIKGEHCGKYVRRIHHQYEGEEAIVILAVVQRVDGHVNTLMEERLELDVSHLCVCDESREDKKLNSSLMDELREEARKTWAK